MNEPTLMILGPTASGKTRLAVEVARRIGACILSADSRQVYRGMDIGTGKDRHEYGGIPVEGLDVRSPGEPFSMWDFLQLAEQVRQRCQSTQTPLIIAGGTGMYLSAVAEHYRLVRSQPTTEQVEWLDRLDHEAMRAELLKRRPAQHNQTDWADPMRTRRALEIALSEEAGAEPLYYKAPVVVVGLRCVGPTLRARIGQRLRDRLAAGLIDEVVRLRDHGVPDNWLEAIGLEYRYVSRYLQGKLNHNDMVQKLESAIYEFARKQNKWFRRMARKGVAVHWLDAHRACAEDVLKILELSGHDESL